MNVVTSIRGLRMAGVLALAGLAASTALAQSAPPREYMAHWGVGTWLSRTRGVDYQAQIDLANTPIKRDVVILYESWLGNFPYAGPHLVDSNAAMQSHLLKVSRDVAAIIPDVNFSGYAVIDYETWFPVWSRLQNTPSSGGPDARDSDFKDDWEDHIKRDRPQVLAGLSGDAYQRALETTFNQAAQRFYLETLRECKRLRPKAKWGFYGFPYGEYYVTYAPYRDRWKNLNSNEMNWMFDAVDALFPHVYSVMHTVEDRQPVRNTPENSPAQNAEYIMENVREAVRVSRGKPVLAFVHFKHHPNAGAQWAGKWVPDTVIRQNLELPKQAGAIGVVIWDFLENEQQFRELRDAVPTKILPVMNAVAVMPPPAAPARIAGAPAAPRATKLPNGQVVVGKAKGAPKIANVPN
jgi:hyaluronoglucosaminidase